MDKGGSLFGGRGRPKQSLSWFATPPSQPACKGKGQVLSRGTSDCARFVLWSLIHLCDQDAVVDLEEIGPFISKFKHDV